MEHPIREIVKYELRKVFSEIYSTTANKSTEDVIYDFDKGRSFGINNLSQDIKGLDEYYLTNYFPHSEMKETWMFEIESYYRTTQIVEVIHEIKPDYNSYWKLELSTLENNSSTPTITKTIEHTRGYHNFIKKVNSELQREIDPSLL
jgi:hypothetical protein